MRFSQNNMLEKTKKYKKIIVVCIVAILFMVISFIFIYQTYIQKIIYEERLNQMDEVTHQMFLNLEDVMETKWDYVKVQCNIIEAADIRTTEDLSLHMKRITDLYEFADSKITLLAVDDSGKYYTEEGNQGMVRDTYHFEHSPKKINYVSNFMTTNESRMVFLKKLEHPIRLQSGQTINYYGLYQDMHELNEYFGCDAYENNNSVYILDDNGFKLFNSNKVELIKGHNVFTVLKKMQYLHDSSFDKAEKELKEKGVSYSNAILDGTEYFYVLKKMDHAAWNLIFLVPAKYVATNTVRLVKLIIWFIILFAVVAAGCMIKGKIQFLVEECETKSSAYAKYHFAVIDNGVGMSEDFKDKIFDTFTREESSLTNKIQGTGLGMAITKNLIEAMGGTIDVDSELGLGSCFEVFMDLKIAEESVSSALQVEESETYDDIMKGMRFLCAEDNELNAEILTELLKIKGAECTVCENGERILETFERSAPGDYDMILMDVQMPVMNGYEATKAIRKSSHEQAKTIPIIAMTANAFSDDIHHSLTVGMNAHISKPVEMKVLEKTISSIKFGGGEAQITEQ